MTDEQIREASEEEFRSHARSLSYIAITDFPHLIEWDIRLGDFQKAFEAGANFATEKCQEEIKRLKEEIENLKSESLQLFVSLKESSSYLRHGEQYFEMISVITPMVAKIYKTEKELQND